MVFGGLVSVVILKSIPIVLIFKVKTFICEFVSFHCTIISPHVFKYLCRCTYIGVLNNSEFI